MYRSLYMKCYEFAKKNGLFNLGCNNKDVRKLLQATVTLIPFGLLLT